MSASNEFASITDYDKICTHLIYYSSVSEYARISNPALYLKFKLIWKLFEFK